MSSKEISKRKIKLHWDWYKEVLEGVLNTATKRGMRMNGGVMCTYEQKKLGPSAYYDKRWMLKDGIHTEPLEYHIKEEA